jgi:hypothetical protein
VYPVVKQFILANHAVTAPLAASQPVAVKNTRASARKVANKPIIKSTATKIKTEWVKPD